MPEDSAEILKRIGIKEELPFFHKTQGKLFVRPNTFAS